MKKLLIVASALAAISLLAPSTGFAVPADNQFGIYSNASAGLGSQNFVVAASTPFNAYVVLTQPVDNGGTPVDQVEAYEFMITFSNGTSVFKLGETLPAGAINIGDTSSPALGLDYTVGLASPITVVSGAVSMVTLNMMVLVTDPIDVFIVNSRAGNMQYQEVATASLVPAYPSSSSEALPVASFNGTVTANEEATWGNVKALYR